ncbi:MAG: metal-dependent hydrolase, partial [Methylococcus sp.]
MIAATHADFATGLYLGGSALFEYPAEPVGWGLAVFFSLVPDIDLPTSRIGRPLFWLSVRLERQHGHRTVTHSLVALLLVAGVASPLFAVGRGGWFWAILGG